MFSNLTNTFHFFVKKSKITDKILSQSTFDKNVIHQK